MEGSEGIVLRYVPWVFSSYPAGIVWGTTQHDTIISILKRFLIGYFQPFVIRSAFQPTEPNDVIILPVPPYAGSSPAKEILQGR